MYFSIKHKLGIVLSAYFMHPVSGRFKLAKYSYCAFFDGGERFVGRD